MQYCHVCGTPLTADDFNAGRCAQCGATALSVPEPDAATRVLGALPGDLDATTILGTGALAGDDPNATVSSGYARFDDSRAARFAADDTLVGGGPAAAGLSADDWLANTRLDRRDPPPANGRSAGALLGLVVGLLVAVALLVACAFGVVAAMANRGVTQAASSPVAHTPTAPPTAASTPTPSAGVFGFPTQAADPTPLPYTYATPTVAATDTPTGGPPATPGAGVTPPPTPIVNPPPTPIQTPPTPIQTPPTPVQTPGGPGEPVLVVVPTVLSTVCGHDKVTVQFFIENTGSGTLHWTAAPTEGGPDYQITPDKGNVAPGMMVTVTVANLARSGTISVAADVAVNSPQTVQVQCLN